MIEDYVTRKCVCLKQKKPANQTRASLTNVTTQPFELVSIDLFFFLHLDKCKGGYEYSPKIIDHFTCFTHNFQIRQDSGRQNL